MAYENSKGPYPPQVYPPQVYTPQVYPVQGNPQNFQPPPYPSDGNPPQQILYPAQANYPPQGSYPTSGYAPATNVTIMGTGLGGGGGCPNCRVGFLNDDYGCCAIFLAIFFFPLGILCCLALKERRCSNCNAVF